MLICLMFMLCACNDKPDNLNQTVYDVGLQAVETIEMYQDDKMSAEEAVNRLEDFKSEIEDVEGTFNDSVKTDIFIAIQNIDQGKSAIDELNSLKETLNK